MNALERILWVLGIPSVIVVVLSLIHAVPARVRGWCVREVLLEWFSWATAAFSGGYLMLAPKHKMFDKDIFLLGHFDDLVALALGVFAVMTATIARRERFQAAEAMKEQCTVHQQAAMFVGVTP